MTSSILSSVSVSVSIVTMASLTEFYLTTMRAYKPKAIERVIEGFMETELVTPHYPPFLALRFDRHCRLMPRSRLTTSITGSRSYAVETRHTKSVSYLIA